MLLVDASMRHGTVARQGLSAAASYSTMNGQADNYTATVVSASDNPPEHHSFSFNFSLG